MKYILLTTALAAVACLAWLEIALMFEHSATTVGVKIAYAFCIGAVGAVRYVLFLSSSTLYSRRPAFGWLTGSMSLGATIGLYFYAENLAGLEDNVKLIYHLLNSLIACSEIAAALSISSVNELADLKNRKHQLGIENNQLRTLLKKIRMYDPGKQLNQAEVKRLTEELQSIRDDAERWREIRDRIGVVHRKNSRYLTITPEILIASVSHDGKMLASELSVPTETKVQLNGSVIHA